MDTNLFDGIKKDVAIYFDKLKDTPKKSIDFHNLLRNYVYNLSPKYGFSAFKEWGISNYDGNGRTGYIDVLWFDKNTRIAIEIDSSPRIKSVVKLIKSRTQYKIWICCGYKRYNDLLVRLGYTHEINLIEIENYRDICRRNNCSYGNNVSLSRLK